MEKEKLVGMAIISNMADILKHLHEQDEQVIDNFNSPEEMDYYTKGILAGRETVINVIAEALIEMTDTLDKVDLEEIEREAAGRSPVLC